MIKAIILDWGGVLIDDPVPGFIAYCSKYLKVSEEEFRKAIPKFHFDFARGIISEGVFWKKVCSKLKISEPSIPSLLGKAFRAVYSEKSDILSIASSLKENGYKIALLSNTEVPMMNYFYEKQYQIFDVAVFSCIEGIIKPDRRIYEITLKKLDVRPQEAVFVDDKEENISSARKIGINTVLFKDSTQFRKELSSFLCNSKSHLVGSQI